MTTDTYAAGRAAGKAFGKPTGHRKSVGCQISPDQSRTAPRGAILDPFAGNNDGETSPQGRTHQNMNKGQHMTTDTLQNCEISAVSFQGLTVKTASGEPATLAVVDKDGKIIESGPGVLKQTFDVAVESYRNFLKGTGHLRVLAKPPGAA